MLVRFLEELERELPGFSLKTLDEELRKGDLEDSLVIWSKGAA